ncbi:MAG: IreB family regulatory phosphoprotein [Clostridia bacterium]|nr:IreB family regulatory phosphoprotein [Clostridia bacterium]
MRKIDIKKEQEIREMLQLVYDALKERGFMDPLNQIWLYLMTEDETYITTYNDARKKIAMYDRDDIGCCLLEHYLKK